MTPHLCCTAQPTTPTPPAGAPRVYSTAAYVHVVPGVIVLKYKSDRITLKPSDGFSLLLE